MHMLLTTHMTMHMCAESGIMIYLSMVSPHARFLPLYNIPIYGRHNVGLLLKYVEVEPSISSNQ